MDLRIVPNKYFLSYILSVRGKRQLRHIIKSASDEEIRTILELIGNLNEGNFAARISDLEKLKPLEGELDSLFNDRVSISLKRRKLVNKITLLTAVLKASKTFIKDIPPYH